MADPFVFNIAKGCVKEYYRRVKNNDPANSALVLVPLTTTGLEPDATLVDKDTLADVLAGSTDESTLGRKVLTDAQLDAVATPNDASDFNECSLPTTTWSLASGTATAKLLVCYDSDTTGGTDSNIIPLTCMDFVHTPSGVDIQLTGGPFFRAS